MSDNIEFHDVAAADALGDEEAMAVTVGKMDIALYNLGGEIFATADLCTHAYASMADGFIDDGQIECPLHGACFDIKTGKALTAPASVDLQTFPVKVENGRIFVGVASE